MRRVLLAFCLVPFAPMEVAAQPSRGERTDLVIFSYDRPLQLYALLESLKTHVTGLAKQTVIYRASDQNYELGYSLVQEDFPSVRFMAQGPNPAEDFKPLTLAAVFESKNAYVLFAVDDIVVTDHINLAHAVDQLEQTKAYGFFFRLGLHHNYCYMNKAPMALPPMEQVFPGVYQWRCLDGTGEWNYPNSLDMVLYRKKDIAHDLRTMRWPEPEEKIKFTSPNRMEAIWAAQWAVRPDDRTGLCYESAKLINIPANLVQDFTDNSRHANLYTPAQLLELFLAGKKIDIGRLNGYRGVSVHAEIPYNFIDRETKPRTDVPQKQFVIVVASYNNEKWARENLVSVFTQRYTNWRMIYINDCSRDKTGELAEQIVAEYNMQDKVTIIHNDQRMGALANIDRAIRSCSDHKIVVSLDGDDKFPHDDVLGLLNEVYADPAIWITYGQYRNYPDQGIGVCQQIPKSVVYQNLFRELKPFVISHLRTFYAWLYKQVKVEDLMHDGRYLPMAWDMAFMIPMMEMARVNFRYLPYELYTYNMSNPINDFKVDLGLSQWCDQYVRSKEKYGRVYNAKIRLLQSVPKADLFVLSSDKPEQLERLLASAAQYVTGVAHTTVLFRASAPDAEQKYAQLRAKFPAVEFVDQGQKPLLNFQPLLLVNVFKSYAGYVLFATDECEFTAPVNLVSCIDYLQRTEAYAFYLDCEPVATSRAIDSSVCAWIFSAAGRQPHTLRMGLYRKRDIQEDFMKTSYINPETLLSSWQLLADPNKVGLCFNTVRMVRYNFASQNHSPRTGAEVV